MVPCMYISVKMAFEVKDFLISRKTDEAKTTVHFYFNEYLQKKRKGEKKKEKKNQTVLSSLTRS